MKGLENFDKAGPNPIVALNHVSFLDAAAILAVMPKAPVFAIDREISQKWWVKPFLKFARAIPLDPANPFGARALINAVKDGNPLVIFPEGRLTVTGSLMKVYDGAGLIAEKSGAMIVPVRIDGAEATMFSRLTREQARRRWFPKFTLTALEPVRLAVDDGLKGKARRIAAGAALYQIMSDLVFRTTDVDRTLFEAVVEAARAHGLSRVALEDPVAGKLSYRRLLIGTRALAGKIANIGKSGDAIGLMLPNANGAGIAFLAVISAGRTPAMINFTAGAANILSGCEAAQARTILTSRGFIEKAKLEKLVAALEEKVAIVYLEDIRRRISFADKLDAFRRFRKPVVARKADDMAAILFTSGSEGAPKGVALSHKNMLANAAQAAARIDFGRTDKVFNVLPMFHSFGLTVGFTLPVISGVPIYLYPSPLHYRIVPELVYGSNATILFGTDTFLAGYARAAHAYDFRSIRYVVAGAEPVKQSTRDMWMDKFGIRILEGYGVTEAAPVLALNTPMFNKSGTVGRLMPGVEHKLEPVPGVEHGGRLLVRGPNVMMGYLKIEKPGVAQPPENGWHDTGDIVTIDAAGLCDDQGTGEAFRQDRRRDGLARGDRTAGGGALARRHVGGGDRDRSAQGRENHSGHAATGRDARGFSKLRQIEGRVRSDDPSRNHDRRARAAPGLRQGRFRDGHETGARARALYSVQSAAAQRSARAYRRQRRDFGLNRGCAPALRAPQQASPGLSERSGSMQSRSGRIADPARFKLQARGRFGSPGLCQTPRLRDNRSTIASPEV